MGILKAQTTEVRTQAAAQLKTLRRQRLNVMANLDKTLAHFRKLLAKETDPRTIQELQALMAKIIKDNQPAGSTYDGGDEDCMDYPTKSRR